MWEADEGAGGAAGAAGGEVGRGGSDGQDAQVGAAAQGGPDGSPGPSGCHGSGEGPRGLGNPEGSPGPDSREGSGPGHQAGSRFQRAPGDQGGPSGPVVGRQRGSAGGPDHRGPDGISDAGIGEAPCGLGPRENTVTPARRLFKFYIAVRFPTAQDAEVARRFLAPIVHSQRGVIPVEFRVNGNRLIVKLAAEDVALFRKPINSFMGHLSLVTQPVWRTGSPASQSPRYGEGPQP